MARTRCITGLLLSLALLSVIPTVMAQDAPDTTRDPAALAARLLAVDAQAVLIPPPTPLYAVGDTTQFWVNKVEQAIPVQITTRLAALTPSVYLWVEDGLEYDPAAMQELAGGLTGIFAMLRMKDNYPDPRIAPDQNSGDIYPLLAVPDVDNDTHLNIVYARDLSDAQVVIYNAQNSLPAPLSPGGYSNQRETLLVNTSMLAQNTPPSDPAYLTLLTQAYYQYLADYNTPGQSPWLQQALGQYILGLMQSATPTETSVGSFLDAPNTSLMTLPGVGNTAQVTAAQQLFLYYIQQRFGDDVLARLFMTPGEGLAPLDAALRENRVTDLVTGEQLSGADVFADFVMANALNQAVGDGRYNYTALTLNRTVLMDAILRDQLAANLLDSLVNQFGTRYLALTNTNPVAFRLTFSGAETASRLPMPADVDPGNMFYWSGNGLNQDTTLTRSFDLTGVSSATLTFDVWHYLADQWTYVYVEVSTDGGQTWTILPANDTSSANAHGVSYGTGYTGISNPEGFQPFPYLGVGLGGDGLTISSIVPGEAVDQTDIEVGDTIIGYDEQVWQGQPNLIAWLSNYRPGDTVNLYMQRGTQRFSALVTLGVHPTRVFVPDALWLPQTVNLSDYAGQNILVRFEYVSQPDEENLGFALDNIAIPEISFSDHASNTDSGWQMVGWQRIANQTPQRFLLQVATISSDATVAHVRRLIGPDDDTLSGSWDFTLEPDQFFIVAVSAMNADTTSPARFDLQFTPVPNQTSG